MGIHRLGELVGTERELDETGRVVYAACNELRAPAFGALLVTCADECERECAEAFQRTVADYLLPSWKLGARGPLRISNLGSRLEPGALGIADDHFSTAAARRGFKLLLVKINSHVCAEPRADGPRFGVMRRYDSESTYCGALHALLDGSDAPFARELRSAFTSGGRDRLAALRQLPNGERALFAGLTNARLQALRAVEEIRALTPGSPTLFVVLSCVTLNRSSVKDTEIVCGVDVVDRRADPAEESSRSIGDDPDRYRLRSDAGRWAVDTA